MTPSQDPVTTLPALIRQTRMHLDLSYEQLAKKMDTVPCFLAVYTKHVTRPAILRQVEEGTHTPSGVLLAKYAHALGLSEDHLLSVRRFPDGDKPLVPDHPGRTLCEVCDRPIPDHAACFTDPSTGFSYHPTCRPIPKTAQEESCAACHQPPTEQNPLITTTTGTREHVLECPTPQAPPKELTASIEKPRSISSLLRRLMEEKSWCYIDLAKALGIPREGVLNMLSGDVLPLPSVYQGIAGLTGYSTEFLETLPALDPEPTNPLQEAYEALTVHNNPARAAVLLHQYLQQ